MSSNVTGAWDPAMSRVAAISGSRIRLPGERAGKAASRQRTWPAKNPLDQRLQDPRGLEQIPNPQAEFSET